MGGAVQAVTKPIAKVIGVAPSAPAAAAAPVSAAMAAKPEAASVGLGRAESEVQAQLAARRGKRGRASTVLGGQDEVDTGGTATKRLLGE